MNKWMLIAVTVIASGIIGMGCEEWLVGAPCAPETDLGVFTPGITGTNYAIETRSVQCDTGICVTVTEGTGNAADDQADNDYDKYEGTEAKYSFCSCRCKDADGHKYDRNNDKYDDLCECPPNTMCEQVLSNAIADAPEKIKGWYCIPKCIIIPCDDSDEVCTPSSDSKEPWKWACK
jgi:hypothetical protein